jgi:hypothetical protein
MPSSSSVLKFGAIPFDSFLFLYHHQEAITRSVRGTVRTSHNHHNPVTVMCVLFSEDVNIPASKTAYPASSAKAP